MVLKRLNLRPSPSLLPRLKWKPSQSESMTLPRACLRRLHLHLRRRIHLRLHLQCDPCPLRLDSFRSWISVLPVYSFSSYRFHLLISTCPASQYQRRQDQARVQAAEKVMGKMLYRRCMWYVGPGLRAYMPDRRTCGFSLHRPLRDEYIQSETNRHRHCTLS